MNGTVICSFFNIDMDARGEHNLAGALQVSFEVLSAPSKLCVWNYNSVRTRSMSFSC